MAKFKVGDKIKGIGVGTSNITHNKIYTVIDSNPVNNTVWLNGDNGIMDWFTDNRFELVIESKFKVGDRIKNVCTDKIMRDFDTGGLNRGKYGTIYEINSSGSVIVKYDDGATGVASHQLACLVYELVKDGCTKTMTELSILDHPYLQGMRFDTLFIDEFTKYKWLASDMIGISVADKINNNKNNIMNKIQTFVKNLVLSSDEILLRKYGLHNDCGEVTNDGQNAILINFFNTPENQAYLLSIAQGLDVEAKASK